jgi:hypothetical protein
LAALVALGSVPVTRAAELAAIERVIGKEPAYQGKPRYCLLVFGKEAATRIWLVQDGNRLYVDRNGNGDLSEPGESVSAHNGTYFSVDRVREFSGTAHQHLRITSMTNGTFSLTLGEEGQRGQFVGIGRMERPTWGDKAASAPIIHLAGPMTLERYGPIYTVPRGAPESANRRFKLRLLLGTPGLGKGTFASYDDLCSENLGPVQADIEYPTGKPGLTLRHRTELIHDG